MSGGICGGYVVQCARFIYMDVVVIGWIILGNMCACVDIVDKVCWGGLVSMMSGCGNNNKITIKSLFIQLTIMILDTHVMTIISSEIL